MKVGAIKGLPLIWMVVECERLPLDPTRLRNHVVVPLKLSLTFTLALAVPFPRSTRMVGLIPTPNPRGGDEANERETFPANPFRLVTVMVENPIEPAVMVRFDGEALIAKSGVALGVTLAELEAGTAKTTVARRRKSDRSMIGVLKKATSGFMILPNKGVSRLSLSIHLCSVVSLGQPINIPRNCHGQCRSDPSLASIRTATS